jgi:SET and MYND domain-containing protein 4
MKSDKVASNFRAKADELVATGNFFDALKQYNKCLQFATSKSAESSAAFGSRADIYYNAGLYRECIENVQLAKISSSVVNRKDLEELEKKCESVTVSSSYENEKCNFFKLSHEAHQKVPFIANCVEVRENEIYGRYLATTRDLNAGDIIVLEEPFYKVLAPSEQNVRCSICLRKNYLNLIPCANCSTGRKFQLFDHIFQN